MSSRLLSLLTDIERAMVANDPSPNDGTWDSLRLINFNQGLARLTLSIRAADGVTRPSGTILLQNFVLADGSQCMKANLTWHGTDHTAVYAIYSKPELNWTLEASQIANKWLDGRHEAEEAAAQAAAAARPAGALLQAAS